MVCFMIPGLGSRTFLSGTQRITADGFHLQHFFIPVWLGESLPCLSSGQSLQAMQFASSSGIFGAIL